jgi:N-6 DNA Methylase
LLMAKSQKIDLDEGLNEVAGDLAKSSTLIGRAFDLLTKQEDLLGPSLKTLVRVLNVVDWNVIAKGNPEAWIDFYELFLSVYDNRLRKLTGSYYTPPEVVRAMVRLCDEALKSRFNKPAGLADAEVQIADPAVGSGTFLLGLLRHMADWKEADEGKGAVGPFITEAAKRLFGFELQFGPFAVAQLRLHAEMIELKASGSPRLFVTDTLSDPDHAFERGTGIYGELSKSQEAANEVKRAQPITVVIGKDPAFARELRLALQQGYEALEMALLQSGLAGSHEHDDWRENDRPAIPPMTANQALQLMYLHQKEALMLAELIVKRRRGESDEAHEGRLIAIQEAWMERQREAFDVAEAARWRRGEPAWGLAGEAVRRELGLPDLAQVTGWSQADPAKAAHDPKRALFGGWQIEEMEAKLREGEA